MPPSTPPAATSAGPAADAAVIARAWPLFVAIHRLDPQGHPAVGQNAGETTWALHYHEQLRGWVERLCAPEPPSLALALAAMCQHLRRWDIPRSDYPAGRGGYKRWRRDLAKRHVRLAHEVLQPLQLDPAPLARLEELILKQGLAHDPEVQLFEDAICLVFLENQLAAFAAKHDAAKMKNIVRKTWNKMSPTGHSRALKAVERMPAELRALVTTAVADS